MAKMPDHVDFDVRIHGVPTGYKLVPIDPPDDLAYQLTGYSLHPIHGLSERDRKVIRERLRERWDAILDVFKDAPGVEGKP